MKKNELKWISIRIGKRKKKATLEKRGIDRGPSYGRRIVRNHLNQWPTDAFFFTNSFSFKLDVLRFVIFLKCWFGRSLAHSCFSAIWRGFGFCCWWNTLNSAFSVRCLADLAQLPFKPSYFRWRCEERERERERERKRERETDRERKSSGLRHSHTHTHTHTTPHGTHTHTHKQTHTLTHTHTHTR